jgi:DNA-binding protein HU-beta
MKLKLETGDNVYLRGFEVLLKTRAENRKKYFKKYNNKIPAHNIPAFKPAKFFVEGVKTNNEAKY